MMAATVLSKVLGLLRETMLAAHYGAGNSVAEAFSSALSVPSTFFDILFSAAILGAFIPVYNSFKGKDDEADNFACIFLNFITLLTGLLALLGIIFARPIINIVTPHLQDPELAVRIVRILFPMIIFTGMAYTLVGLMQSKGRFFLPALISSISNAGVIIYFLFLDNIFGVNGLAVAYAASWLIQFLTLAIPLHRSGFRFRLRLNLRDEHLKTALKMVLPIMVGSWLSPMTILIGKHFAAPLGGVAVFNYANQTYIMIAGILVYSICNYVFPTLSRLADEGDDKQFISTVRTGTLTSMAIIVPFMAAVTVLCGQGCAILYMRGQFTAENTADTASLLRIIALAMPAYGVVEIFSRVFYARKKTLFPMLASLVGVGVIFALPAIALALPGGGMQAIASGVACGQWCAALLLLISAGFSLRGLFDGKFILGLAKLALCGGAAFAVMFFVNRLIGADPYSSGMIKNLLVCCAVFAAGMAVYLPLAVLLKAIPMKKIKE